MGKRPTHTCYLWEVNEIEYVKSWAQILCRENHEYLETYWTCLTFSTLHTPELSMSLDYTNFKKVLGTVHMGSQAAFVKK